MITHSKRSRSQTNISTLNNPQKRISRLKKNNRVYNSNRFSQKKGSNVLEEDKIIRSAFTKPLWLKALLLLHQASSVSCLIMVGGMLGVYGMTVYAPQVWTRAYQELNILRKYERQMTSTNEIMVDQLADTANNKGTGLIDPNPSNPPIYLQETNTKPLPSNNISKPTLKQPKKFSPLAY